MINSAAPIRICDLGGWTDTWFARRGKVLNLAVTPRAEVQIEVRPRSQGGPRVTIRAENFGDLYAVDPAREGGARHPLLEAAVGRVGVPEELAVTITLFSRTPAGASTGTSAAVAVALLGALDRLTPGVMSRREVAYLAHSVEAETLGRQCGVQDQLCAAYGGVNFIEIDSYPHATVTPVGVSPHVWWELERRLTLIYLGRSHNSSEVHKKVIGGLEGGGPECESLEELRRTAERSRDALLSGDFDAFGRAMSDNTEAQGRLHPELVGRDARRVIEVARAHGASGWKVNGAGGDGGSVTILGGPLSHRRRSMTEEILAGNPLYAEVPLHLDPHGLRVWETSSEDG